MTSHPTVQFLEAKMKQFVIAGTLAGALAVGGTALAQQPTPPAPKTAPAPKAAAKPAPAAEAKTADQAEKPVAKPRAKRAASADTAPAGHAAPKAQPNTTDNPNATDTAMVLGTVRLAKKVKADGKELPAGSYQLRLTADEAKPDAKGSSEVLERWVEFVKGGKVVGREVVSIVPANEAKLVQKDTPPPSGGSKVETLKGGDYIRVWINKGGNYYLVHLAA
jgi:hypothetical protein